MNKITILLVDDLKFMRTALRNIVEASGMTVAGEASDGLQAVTLYTEKNPDIVLMDITMPVMNGIESLAKIMKLDPFARVIMCSAIGQNKYIIQSIQLGARDFIIKPFKPERILSSVLKVMGRNEEVR